jgi:DNA-binding NarL/FixJ family response regulator
VPDWFSKLYADISSDDKARLKETIKAIAEAHDMLRLQWKALGQSPDHGVAVFAKVKNYYPEVPFVFYSRKITPEDAIRVLKAGVVDAIRKGALQKSKCWLDCRVPKKCGSERTSEPLGRAGLM